MVRREGSQAEVRLPDHIAVQWPIWRIVNSPKCSATLEEIRRYWTIDLVYAQNEILDAFEDAEHLARVKAEREAEQARRG